MFSQKISGSADVDGSFKCTFPIPFRLCSQDDLRKLEWFGMFSSDRAIIEQAFADQEAGKNLMLLVEANRFPIGQVWIDFTRKQAQSGGILWALRVLPPFQSQNIGTRLERGRSRIIEARFRFCRAFGGQKQ